jgi:glycerophosphoryl diester phosphodiesterase
MPAVIMLLLLVVGGVVGGIWGTQALLIERPVKIIAHRGAAGTGPENSAPAFERAIADGADVLETDVQLTRDGHVVVIHDSDFSRLAGVAKKVPDLTWDEIKKIDIGSKVGPNYRGVYSLRLEDLLALARNRIHLNIELKHYAPVDERLEKKVVDLLHQYAVLDQIEIQSLEYESVMAVRRLDPAIKIGYLLSVNARETKQLKVDFISVEASRVNARFLRKARKANQLVYVWTVNKREDMERLMDLGVDGLITDASPIAVQLIKERQSLSPHDKALRRIRTWLAK